MDIAPGIAGAQEPQAAFLKDGRLIVVFGSGTTLYTAVQSIDGKRFEPPSDIGNYEGLMLGKRRGPRIAVSGTTVVVTACFGKRMAQDLFAFQSEDDGQTFPRAVRVNDQLGAAREGLQALARSSDGSRFGCVWLDDRSGRKELYYAESADLGGRWSENRRIYASPDGSICECCHPSLTAAENSEFVAMWRNSLNGNRDMYAGIVLRDGVLNPIKQGSGSWAIQACPMDGGAICRPSNNRSVSVFRREGTVYMADSSTEVSLGRGEQPWVATDGSAVCAVWLERRLGNVKCRWLDGKSPETVLDTTGDDPMVVAGPKGAFAVVWTGRNGPRACILRRSAS